MCFEMDKPGLKLVMTILRSKHRFMFLGGIINNALLNTKVSDRYSLIISCF